jgi:hypothetical protein
MIGRRWCRDDEIAVLAARSRRHIRVRDVVFCGKGCAGPRGIGGSPFQGRQVSTLDIYLDQCVDLA